MPTQAGLKYETKLAIELVQQFERLTPLSPKYRKSGKEGLKGWQVLAVETATRLKTEYELPQSALSSKKRLLAELKGFSKEWLMDKQTFHPVQTIIAHFRETLNLLFSEIQNGVNEEYRNRVDTRSADGNRIEIDLSEWLAKAETTLQKVVNGVSREDLKWEDVSCALALATGRRMSELHYSAVFQHSAEYELVFSGQLKGKNRTESGDKLINHEFTIPTLVKAELCIAGLEWLAANDKRADKKTGSPELVNKRWAKYVGGKARSDWQIVTDEIWQSVDPKDKWTFHKFRGLYFIACLSNLAERATFSSIKRLAPLILGDSDIKAIEPYERFDITPNSKTRI